MDRICRRPALSIVRFVGQILIGCITAAYFILKGWKDGRSNSLSFSKSCRIREFFILHSDSLDIFVVEFCPSLWFQEIGFRALAQDSKANFIESYCTTVAMILDRSLTWRFRKIHSGAKYCVGILLLYPYRFWKIRVLTKSQSLYLKINDGFRLSAAGFCKDKKICIRQIYILST